MSNMIPVMLKIVDEGKGATKVSRLPAVPRVSELIAVQFDGGKSIHYTVVQVVYDEQLFGLAPEGCFILLKDFES